MLGFDVVSGTVAREVISESRKEVIGIVRDAYLAHEGGDSVNPNSYFLRFPEKPSARIIALPAYLGDGYDVAGIKWIASFPENVERNVPRASAVLLLNDYATGYPFACLEASQISAARTAASCVLGAAQLHGSCRAARIAVVGAGVIARNILDFFVADGWDIGQFALYDQVPGYADALVSYARETLGTEAERTDSLESAVKGADLVVLATTAGTPYITDPHLFEPGQVVLNISLRDIAPEIILGAHNVVDDIDHCLTANTSVHLAEQSCGHRGFVDGTLAQVIEGKVRPGDGKPRIFSPFGLGVLDLAVGSFVYRNAVESGRTTGIDGFFAETERWQK
ncbi:2,3-diaminopropionate biosynthesis protein SbnB [Streptomyces ferrugineus]|uniref:2,3-diaminopropionate biosynthesis protein SbnB n=1 Tax=Streptomyces ferrugineus TaxID=1413221 RepID=A0A7M2SKR7_9ACTN|nr:2,3-diaminopropionate biosynthesis protein SbnB [Streptomyces ferrugineus]QOV36599.1 2,3-diaminopropionate biosynthesis protein SbnB [Streptomyces ferrugineus]